MAQRVHNHKQKKTTNKITVNKLALTYISHVAMRLPVPSPWKALTSEGFSKRKSSRKQRLKKHVDVGNTKNRRKVKYHITKKKNI
jgi:hypothetical protein